jgi:hypothetical protein
MSSMNDFQRKSANYWFLRRKKEGEKENLIVLYSTSYVVFVLLILQRGFCLCKILLEYGAQSKLCPQYQVYTTTLSPQHPSSRARLHQVM